MEDLIDFDKCSEKEKQYLLEAVKQDGCAIEYIHNPCQEVIKISKMNFIEKMKYFCKTE